MHTSEEPDQHKDSQPEKKQSAALIPIIILVSVVLTFTEFYKVTQGEKVLFLLATLFLYLSAGKMYQAFHNPTHLEATMKKRRQGKILLIQIMFCLLFFALGIKMYDQRMSNQKKIVKDVVKMMEAVNGSGTVVPSGLQTEEGKEMGVLMVQINEVLAQYEDKIGEMDNIELQEEKDILDDNKIVIIIDKLQNFKADTLATISRLKSIYQSFYSTTSMKLSAIARDRIKEDEVKNLEIMVKITEYEIERHRIFLENNDRIVVDEFGTRIPDDVDLKLNELKNLMDGDTEFFFNQIEDNVRSNQQKLDILKKGVE